MLKEFKEFAMRGNVVDMAVGIVIGSAFGAIVTELVGKVITPIVGYMQGGVDFKDKVYKLPVPELAEGVAAPSIGYGAVLQALLNFLIVAFVLFLVIKGMNTLKKKEEAAPSAPPEEILLLREIRDSLAKN
ncbi:large-conductance mechanosensitive channel protein MscL [Bythopirellula polymerisocia]|uniref:Large-conductance mechanosensitive channel n=1 Tax=Bythopirellula polymerisocia TaxID=2528003 RepID=A0A5C6CNY7_9BACT|nr:large-conductance mechanosensitive channel protein MscL [Bythopirellula polymerisocia]TWU26098.1 Large-conductance mechanosensitive channel [Bythopirellula polymerisocia]